MISKMRTMAPTIMLIILVAFVVGTIFFDWGMNRGSQGSTMIAAGKINGREIPLQNFDNEVNQERQKAEQSGRTLDPYQYHLIPQQVWERKVNEILMGAFFKKVHLYASADEIFNYIKNNPVPGIDTVSAFLTNGAFDTTKYIAFLNDPRTYEYNPGFRELEKYTREMILPASKLEMLLSAALVPTKAEIEYQYKLEHEKGVFEYASVRPETFTLDSARITESMMKSYYEAHRDTFKSEEQASLYFVKIAKESTPRDEQVYYQELKEMKDRIMEQSDTARAGMFAEEARVSSDDETTAPNGGDLGMFARGAMVPEFDSVAFILPVGTVSDPIKTRFGVHLIYVEKREMDGKVEKVKANHILRKIVPTMESLDELTAKIDTLRSLANEKSFVAAASEAAKKDTAILFDSTGFFQKGGMIPGLGYISGAGRFAFSNEKIDKESVSDRLEDKDGFYLIAIKQLIPKGILPFDVAKTQIRSTLIDSLRKADIQAFAKEWSEKVGEQASLATLKAQDSSRITSGITDTIAAVGFIPGIGSNSKVAAVAFALPVGKRSKLIESGTTWYLVRPLWKSPETPVAMESPDAMMIVNQYANQAKQRLYIDWYSTYKRTVKIESNIDKVYLD
jgi:peptidyl-prolyl cis-trans isomerase D